MNINGSTIHIGGMTFNSFQEMQEYGRKYHPSWYHEGGDGSTITNVGGTIFVNGGPVENPGELIIVIAGNATSVQTTNGNVMVAGQCGSVKTQSGDIHAQVIQGNASTMSGDVNAHTIAGSTSTMSGDINYR